MNHAEQAMETLHAVKAGLLPHVSEVGIAATDEMVGLNGPLYRPLVDTTKPSEMFQPLSVEDDPIISANDNPAYGSLASVLSRAYEQASGGKGKDRHQQSDGQYFEDQPICTISRTLGSIDGNLFQVNKKGEEARRLPKDKAVAELLGAINYLAAAVILVEEGILEP